MRIASFASTFVSLTALGFSGYTLYESALKTSSLAVFVAPRIDYTDPDRPEAVREVFILPLTIANDGARTGTVLSMTLTVANPRSRAVKTFYAARLGTWGETPLKPFTPVVLPGRATFSQTVQFEPRNGETVPRILDADGGTYELSLTLEDASASGRAPVLKFERRIGQLDYRYFNGNGTMEMWAGDYQAAKSGL